MPFVNVASSIASPKTIEVVETGEETSEGADLRPLVQTRSVTHQRQKERPDSEAERRLAAPKFDTSLGESHEMREALRPTESPVSEPDRSRGESLPNRL